MLGGIRLKVVYGQEKTCFVYISQKYCTNSDQSQCVQVISTDKKVLLWVVYSSNIPEGHIACNPIYCRILGLEEDSYVFVCPYGDVKILDELYIDTDSPDDQEILEHNVETLQLRILDQLRFVVAHQKAIVWISSSMPIIFTPKKTGLLVNHSRVVVKMDAFNSFYETLQNASSEAPQKDIKFNNIGIINNGLLKPYMNVPKRLVLRALPIDSDGKKNLDHPFTVFIHEDLVNGQYKDLTIILATMGNIPTIQQENKDEEDKENNNNHINDLCVEIVLISNVVYQSLCQEIYNINIPTVLIPKSLNNIINIENGSRIIFTIIGDKVEEPEHIEILTYTDDTRNENEIVEKFKNCVIKNTHSGKKFLINHGIVKQNNQICNGYLKFKLKPEKLKYTMLNSESFRQCTVSAKCLAESELNLPKPVLSIEYDVMNLCRSMQSVQELVEKVVKHLYFEIHREAVFKGISEIKSNVLITGLSGTGKSSLCHIIQKDVSVFSHILHCRSLKGRKDITEVLAKAILLCQEHSPAVLICDDVDSLVPANLEGASPQDIAYYQRLAVTIKHLLQSCAGVCVLMTALNLKELHPTLGQFAGKPLFTAHFDIPELQKEERMELLSHLINDKIRQEFTIEEDDVIKMAMDTSGCNVRDVTDYLHKQIFKAVKKKNSNPEELKPRLVEPITKDVERTNKFDIWGPVGGLDAVKQQLTECIFWPMMYGSLFKSQSCGVLLYGPPGCGKSHIGSCLAGLTNMELILVKGPELLSKYIGQSEKAVRDVFDKADMKRPCILFFDEFDSLAPKRGQDSTGVTDRVVNQLLARLDGAEGGARGPVLAATARPDLLDPALLRAPRLHAHLYCAPPDTQEDRYSILRTLSKDVSLSEDVDLQDIAQKTAGFSPADLKSLLVTAQLSKLEKQLAENEDKQMESVIVSREDLESALLETKPSLSPEQRLFYDTIYRRFRGEKLTNEQKQIENRMQKQRVTLA